MYYLGQIIVLLSTIVAIRGETWNNGNQGLKKITLSGYLIIIFASIGLVVSIMNYRIISTEISKYKGIIEITATNTAESKLALQKANFQIDSLENKLRDVNTRLVIYQEILDQIKNQSDRQDQTVMMEFVELRPGGSWVSPSLIFSGSIVEFLGFEYELLLQYNSRSVIIPPWDGHAIQTAIMGASGEGFYIRLSNEGSRRTMGKIHIISSPRVRSSDWSWIEERLK